VWRSIPQTQIQNGRCLLRSQSEMKLPFSNIYGVVCAWGPGLPVQDIAKINYNLLYQEIPATLVFEISDDGSYRWIKREHYKGQEDTLKKRLET